MNFELAKQLMEAGFPQEGKGSWLLSPDALVARRSDRVYVPTLSELVEACGGNFDELKQALLAEPVWKWRAKSFDVLFVGRGPSPEEAVARLWLALRK